MFSSLLGGGVGVGVGGTALGNISRNTVTRLTGTNRETLARITGTGAKLTRTVNNTIYLKNVSEALGVMGAFRTGRLGLRQSVAIKQAIAQGAESISKHGRETITHGQCHM